MGQVRPLLRGRGARRRENGGLFASKKAGSRVEGTSGHAASSGGPPRRRPKAREAVARRAAVPIRLERARGRATTLGDLVISSLAALSFLATVVSATVTRHLKTLSAPSTCRARSSPQAEGERRHLKEAVAVGYEAVGLCNPLGPIPIKRGAIVVQPTSSGREGGTVCGRR